MQRVDDERLGETVWEGETPVGSRIIVVPRPHVSKTVLQVAIPFGSCDLSFRLRGDLTVVPPGTAHLLEHVTHASLTQGLGSLPERYGTTVHAQTAWRRTVYSLTTVDGLAEIAPRFLACLGEPPNFAEEVVAKEQRIIAHEIRGNEQSPDARCRQAMIQALYQHHPVRHLVTGTVADVLAITPEALRLSHEAFYHPSRMVVIAMGPIDPERFSEMVSNSLGSSRLPTVAVDRYAVNEPHAVRARRVTERLLVVRPILRVAFKERDLGQTGVSLLRRELLTALALETLRVPMVSADYLGDRSFGYSCFLGATQLPNELEAQLLGAIERTCNVGLDPRLFEQGKKNRLTLLLRYLDQPDRAVSLMMGYNLKGIRLSDYLPTVQSLTVAEANQRLRVHLDPAFAVTSLVH